MPELTKPFHDFLKEAEDAKRQIAAIEQAIKAFEKLTPLTADTTGKAIKDSVSSKAGFEKLDQLLKRISQEIESFTSPKGSKIGPAHRLALPDDESSEDESDEAKPTPKKANAVPSKAALTKGMTEFKAIKDFPDKALFEKVTKKIAEYEKSTPENRKKVLTELKGLIKGGPKGSPSLKKVDGDVDDLLKTL